MPRPTDTAVPPALPRSEDVATTASPPLKKRELSAAEVRRLERLERTRSNRRGRSSPAAVPARLTRTSAFAPRNRDLITDSDFRQRYVVPYQSVIEVSGRELGTQHRDAVYALFRLPRKHVKVRNPEIPANVAIPGKKSFLEFYEVSTTWRHLLASQGRTQHVNNLLTLIRTFEDIKKVVITVYDGNPEEILPMLERNRPTATAGGSMDNIIRDIEWDGLNLDSHLRVRFGTWVFSAFERSHLVSLNADVQFRLKSGYAKNFWPYIDSMTKHSFVDEDMLGHLVGRNILGDAETKNTRGQFRRDCKQAFNDMVRANGLKSWRCEDVGIDRVRKRRYFYEHALARHGELPSPAAEVDQLSFENL